MAVRNFTLDNFKFPNTSDITKKSGYYGFGTDIDGPLSYNEFTDNITMPITSQKAELIEESITIERIEYDLKLLVSNGVVINLPTQNVKIGRKVTVIPRFILNGEEVEGKAAVSAGQYSWKIYWDSFITFCWNGSFWYIDNNLSSYFYYPSPTKFLEKVLFGRIGKNWTRGNITSGSFFSVAYGDDMWVAGSGSGSNHGLYYSTDGRNWSQSNIKSGSFNSVAYGDGKWVAGSDYDSNKGLYYSTDGRNWSQSNIKSGKFYSVAYANGIWVAGCYDNHGLYYSEDGNNWTQSNIAEGAFPSVAYGGDLWVAGNDYNHGLYYSEDGKEWTQSNITSVGFYSVAYGGDSSNGMWVACSFNKGLYYSEDGQNWTQSSNITSGRFNSAAYGDGMWVAGSSSTGLYYSEDGKNWTQSNITEGIFYSVAYANGKWVAGGSSGLYYSEDYGRNFIKVGGYMNLSVNKIIYVDFKIVCTSNDGILVSEID